MGKETALKILIGIPMKGTTMERRLLPLLMHLRGRGMDVDLMLHQCSYSAAGAQEAIFKSALEKGVDYLLMIDNDVIPPIDALERMLVHKKDVLVIPVWHFEDSTGDIHLNIIQNFEEIDTRAHRMYFEGHGLERVSTSSFACILISKKVLQRFNVENESLVTWTPLLGKECLDKPSDNIFFRKALKFGFESYVDWDIKGAIHARQIDLSTKVLERFSARYFGHRGLK